MHNYQVAAPFFSSPAPIARPALHWIRIPAATPGGTGGGHTLLPCKASDMIVQVFPEPEATDEVLWKNSVGGVDPAMELVMTIALRTGQVPLRAH